MSPETKKKLYIALAFVLVAVAGVAIGRFTLSPKVVEHTKTVEVEKVVERVVVQIVEKKVYVRGEDRDVVRIITVVKTPDGTETSTITETDKTKIKEASSQETVVAETRTKETDKTVFVERLKIVESHKNWHLGIRGGAGARFIGELTPQFVIGVQADRRIAGPFFIGLWAETVLNLGPAPPYNVLGGLALSVEL